MNAELLDILGAQLGLPVTNTESVSGGDISQAFILHTNKNKFFLKLNSADKADLFEKELKGLELLINTRTLKVPQPVTTGKWNNHIFLLLEYIEKGKTTAEHWQTFATQLSNLHANNAVQFGLDHDNYIGSLPQQNNRCNTWSEFYTTQRILYLVKKAFDQKKCDTADIKLAERLCNKLDILFPVEPPSLLHGDLWSGNFIINTEGEPFVCDPAVYYGHREMDIGMSLLFGGFDKSFYDHYNECRPMEKNWQQRTDLTQLYPLLVHLVLFGGHYYHPVRDILKKYS